MRQRVMSWGARLQCQGVGRDGLGDVSWFLQLLLLLSRSQAPCAFQSENLRWTSKESRPLPTPSLLSPSTHAISPLSAPLYVCIAHRPGLYTIVSCLALHLPCKLVLPDQKYVHMGIGEETCPALDISVSRQGSSCNLWRRTTWSVRLSRASHLEERQRMPCEGGQGKPSRFHPRGPVHRRLATSTLRLGDVQRHSLVWAG